MSIKDRIASIETGEWRFSSEDEADEEKSQSEVREIFGKLDPNLESTTFRLSLAGKVGN